MCSVPLVNRFCRESYNDPLEVYQLLRQRGMQLVTVTDHDSIDAVERLRSYPDFFLSEEVSCTTSSGTHLHVGVYGITERDHIELARRASDFSSFLAYCDERRLLFTVNHVFSALTGRRKPEDFDEFAARFPAVEILNGCMIEAANNYAKDFARATRKAVMGGSDSHTLAGLAKAYTEVSGARNAREFLEGVRQGHARVAGESGNYAKLTQAIWSIGLSMMDEHPWTIALAPLLAVVPVVTLVNLVVEMAFAWKWGSHTARYSAQDAAASIQSSTVLARRSVVRGSVVRGSSQDPAGAARSAAYAVD
jgi:predicted metal-dependent phosphoesterase TrpH